MRFHWLTCLSLLGIPAVLLAQQSPPATPPAPPATPPAVSPRLDTLLQQWEQKMKSVETLYAECTRTTLDKVYQGTEVFEGTAKYMKPNLAALEMKKKTNVQVFEKYLSTG